MSTLDQAFIKAYTKDSVPAAPAGVQSAASNIAKVPAMAQTMLDEELAPPANAAASQIAPPHVQFAVQPEVPATPSATVTTTRPENTPSQWRIDSRHKDGLGQTGGSQAKWTPQQSGRAGLAHTMTPSPLAMPSLGISKAAPLSSFTAPAPVVETFRPAFEVDRFVWPEICSQLSAATEFGFDHLADQFVRQAQQGAKVIAITGCRRNEGRSAVFITLAQRLAAKRVKAVLVDGDFQMAQLARQLGLSVRIGFDDALAGEQELADVLIDSLADGLTLLPLHQRIYDGIELKDKLRMTVSLGILRDHYDLVLIDAGPLEKVATPRVHCFTPGTGLDGAILVYDPRHSIPEHVALAEQTLEDRGIACLGLIENFAPSFSNG